VARDEEEARPVAAVHLRLAVRRLRRQRAPRVILGVGGVV
jgi:hypothetical protein